MYLCKGHNPFYLYFQELMFPELYYDVINVMLATTLSTYSLLSVFIVLPINIYFWYLVFILTLTSGSRAQKKILKVEFKFTAMNIGEMMSKYYE